MLPIAPELLSPLTGYCQMQRHASGQTPLINRYQQAIELISDMQTLFTMPDFDIGCFPALCDSWLDYHIESLGDLKNLENMLEVDQNSAKSRYLVSLGSVLWPENNDLLLKGFLALQEKHPKLLLATARNSVTHSIADCQALVNRFPDGQLAVNISEFLLSAEPKPLALFKLYKQLKSLAANIGYQEPTFSTAEYQFEPIVYSGLSYFKPTLSTISQIIEGIYCIFCKKVNQLLS